MAVVPCDTELIKNVIVSIIDQNRGHDIVTLDVRSKAIPAKYMIIASGNSSYHVKALSEYVMKSLKTHDKVDVEGMDGGNWVIVNFQGIMVHIFRPEVREYYKIEELWN